MKNKAKINIPDKKNTNKDLRVKRTLENIYNAFQELISETDYEKITVKNLAEKANINKKTFYSYYSSLDELLLEIQEKISDDYIEKIAHYRIPEDYTEMNREFFLFSEEYGKMYEKITINEKYSYIRQQMINKVMNATWKKSGISEKIGEYKYNILISFVQSATLSIYTQWVSDGRKVPLEEIIELSGEILTESIKKFL